MATQRGAQPGPVPRLMECQVHAREAARLLEFGGELAVEQARRHNDAVLRQARAVARLLGPDTPRAA